MTAPHTESTTGGGGAMKIEGDTSESRKYCGVIAAAKGFLVLNGGRGVREDRFGERDERRLLKEDEAGCRFAREVIGWVGTESGEAARGRRDGERLSARLVS